MIGYYGSWAAYGGYTPDKIRASGLDCINYGFALVGSDNRISLADGVFDIGNFAKLRALKEKYPDLRSVISIGGWDGSANFAGMSSTAAGRNAFAASCADFLKNYGFNGVDLDWEYPATSADRNNFTLLLSALREKLDALGASDGRHYTVSFAGGAGAWYAEKVQLAKVGQIVDYSEIMTYDIHGSWDSYTDLNAPLFNPVLNSPQDVWSVDSSVECWLSAGFPAAKLMLGVPFYGYIYSGVSSSQNGLFQTYSSCKSIGFDTIAAKYLGSGGYTRFIPDGALTPCLFGNSNFITYDDAASLAKKAVYAVSKNLGGVAAWELTQDRSAVLLSAIDQVLE